MLLILWLSALTVLGSAYSAADATPTATASTETSVIATQGRISLGTIDLIHSLHPQFAILSGSAFGVDRIFTIDSSSGRIELSQGYHEAHEHKLAVGGQDEAGNAAVVNLTVRFTDVRGPCSIQDVSVGTSGASCATSTSGEFWCWGHCEEATCGYSSGYPAAVAASLRDSDGRIGLAAALEPIPFVPTPEEGKVVQVIGLASDDFDQQTQCLRTEHGNVRCWGNWDYTPYERPSLNRTHIRSPIDSPLSRDISWSQTSASGFSVPLHRPVAHLYAGANHFCAVLEDVVFGLSNLECWGKMTLFKADAFIERTGKEYSHGGVVLPMAERRVPLSAPLFWAHDAFPARHTVALARHTACVILDGIHGHEIHCFGRLLLDTSVAIAYPFRALSVDRWRETGTPVMVDGSTDKICVLYERRQSPSDSVTRHDAVCFGRMPYAWHAFNASIAPAVMPIVEQELGSVRDDALRSVVIANFKGHVFSMAVIEGGVCVSGTTAGYGIHQVQCVRHGAAGDQFSAAEDQGIFLVFPLLSQPEIPACIVDQDSQENVQVVESYGEYQVVSIHGNGCAVCAIAQQLRGGPESQIVRCFGCDGPGYTLHGNSMRGALGYGMGLDGPIGSSDVHGNGREGYAAVDWTHRFGGSTATCSGPANTRGVLQFDEPTADQVVRIDNPHDGAIVARARVSGQQHLGAPVTFSLDPAYPDASFFAVDASTGDVWIQAAASIRADQQYSIGLFAIEDGSADQYQGFVRFSVAVTASAASRVPVFQHPSQSIAESSASDGVFVFQASDPDASLPIPGYITRVSTGITGAIAAADSSVAGVGAEVVVRSVVLQPSTLLSVADVTARYVDGEGIVIHVYRNDLFPGEYSTHVQLVGVDSGGTRIQGSAQPLVCLVTFSLDCPQGYHWASNGSCSAGTPFSSTGVHPFTSTASLTGGARGNRSAPVESGHETNADDSNDDLGTVSLLAVISVGAAVILVGGVVVVVLSKTRTGSGLGAFGRHLDTASGDSGNVGKPSTLSPSCAAPKHVEGLQVTAISQSGTAAICPDESPPTSVILQP